EYLNVQYARCPKCGVVDRQLNAALNLLKTQDESLWFEEDSPVYVAMRRNGRVMNPNPQSRNWEVSLSSIS
ncbi:hypothetical protein, partial [Infirmifilum sp.]|uniref:hypothetical protein n=1 Tax=Infirmifilum sp. TaxID=2856575 RepID=UPI003D118D2D